jgi:hypothetical protein
MREQIITFLQTMLPDNALRTITAQRLRDFFTEFIHAFIFVPRGNFLIGTQYEKNDLAVFNGSSFYCKQPNNDKPVSNTDFWGLLASKGDTGAPKWRGAWNAATAYAIGDSVSQNGNSYISKTAHTNQAVTNTTHWDIVAAKGESGDQKKEYANSHFDNTFGFDGVSNWFNTVINGLHEGYPVLEIIMTNNIMGNNTFVKMNKNRIYKLKGKIKGSANNLLVGGRVYWFNQAGITVNSQEGSSNYNVISTITIASANVWQEFEMFIFFNGSPSIKPADNANMFTFLFRQANNLGFSVSQCVLSEVNVSEAIPHNSTTWLPDGQSVFDNTNPLKKGTYINSTVGIVWHTGKDIPYTPNGTSVAFNIRRAFKFTWAVVYNDGVTIVSQPSGTVNANTDALLTLTGAAGKTLTINIQQTA